MKHEVLMQLSKDELDSYASLLGIDVTGKKTVAQKVSAIEKRRERSEELDVLGMTIVIPMKRLDDKRVSDLANKRALNDEEAMELLRLIIGEDQTGALMDRVTDEDGTVDNPALGLAISRILRSDELKNS